MAPPCRWREQTGFYPPLPFEWPPRAQLPRQLLWPAPLQFAFEQFEILKRLDFTSQWCHKLQAF